MNGNERLKVNERLKAICVYLAKAYGELLKARTAEALDELPTSIYDKTLTRIATALKLQNDVKHGEFTSRLFHMQERDDGMALVDFAEAFLLGYRFHEITSLKPDELVNLIENDF